MNEFRKLGFKFSKSPIKKICSGARHLLFLLENGEVFCVGDNSAGQCCGATSNCAFPIKLELNTKKRVVDCYAGYNHNLIILENGSVYTWGNTANGKLGYFEDKFTQETPKELPEKSQKSLKPKRKSFYESGEFCRGLCVRHYNA